MRLVFIEWVDSYGSSSHWEKVQDMHISPFSCQSVGWLAHDDEHYKVIVPHLTSAGHPTISQQGCGDMAIPAVAIVRMVDLSMPETPTEKQGNNSICPE